MSPHHHLIKSAPALSTEWRTEAMLRLFQGVGITKDGNGSPLEGCWVPVEALDPATGLIVPKQNYYRSVRILGGNYPAHVAVLILAHNRRPIRDYGVDFDEIGLHLCHNPACRNPCHLKFGTHAENMIGMINAGRAASGLKSGHRTMPTATRRGPNLRSHMSKNEQMIVFALIKKYRNVRGYASAIADACGISVATVNNYSQKKAHLRPDVPNTDLELTIAKWKRRKPALKGPDATPIITDIRQRFHAAPVSERSGLLLAFEREYKRSDVWVRDVLNRKCYQEIAPEIPVPDNFGIGRRIHKKPALQIRLL